MPLSDKYGLLEFFLLEAEDHINHLDRGIADLMGAGDKQQAIEILFRSAHTLKGAAALVKLTDTSAIAHKMEDIFEEIRDGNRTASRETIDLLLYMLDSIKSLIIDIAQGKGEKAGSAEAVLTRVDQMLAGFSALSEAEPAKASVAGTEQKQPQAEVSEEKRGYGRRREDFDFFAGNLVKIDLQKVEDMLNLIGEITIRKNYLLQKINRSQGLSDEIRFAGGKLMNEVDGFSERRQYSVSGTETYFDPLLSEFDNLEFDRYDELDLFSRKLQEMTDDLREALKELSEFFEFFNDDMKRVDVLIKQLRTHISETRMIEIGRLFQRFSRPVKDLAAQYNKNVELLMAGGNTMIDKMLFERLFEPLMHIVRNSIGHGIESKEERLAAQKKEIGKILLSARREGNNVIVEVKDNGRGIALTNLFKKAVKLGILSADTKPTRAELLALIFRPGFSTADTTDMTSGRGIGLSAVKEMVSSVNGIIELDTETGKGVVFRIKAPSSLAITNVVVCSAGSMEFVIPANYIEEIAQFDSHDHPEAVIEKISYRGKDISVKDIGRLFGLGAAHAGPTRNAVICNVADRKAGLIVDAIRGQEETVIKPMNRFLAGLTIYSGLTLSGDGSIRPVLNPVRIFDADLKPIPRISAETAEKGMPKVLIVDDSLSIRKYVSAFLAEKNCGVLTASNGIEALDILSETPVDLVITDLEMPVMHGYELLSRIKASDRLKGIPVVVLTSRSVEKHREKAIQFGAADFLVKPFDEEKLSAVIDKYLSITA